MYNVNIFSFGDCSGRMFFDRQFRDNSLDDDNRTAFDDPIDIYCRIDELKEVVLRALHEINILEVYDDYLIDCHTWDDVENALKFDDEDLLSKNFHVLTRNELIQKLNKTKISKWSDD